MLTPWLRHVGGAFATQGAASFAEAKQVAAAVSRSNLVKTAFFGQDANWGRIICAVGYSGVDIDPTRCADAAPPTESACAI